ncbi:MAG: ABC transporter permease [Bacteroidales bacterium]|nr:ABC transporter permease [Bacteroidales bacterium]
MGLFFQNKTEYKVQSISRATWGRLIRNRQGAVLLIFLALTTLIAILGYLITPDSTPYANEQILEIRLLKPLSKVEIASVKKNQQVIEHNIFHKMLFGQTSPFQPIAIEKYWFANDSIVLQRYNEVAPYNIERIHLADMVYAIKGEVQRKNNLCTFTTIDGQQMQISIADLQNSAKQQIRTRTYILGTDRYGRDVLSQLIIGTRVSLSVGFVSVFIALLIGVFLGAIAGYYRGKIDDIIMWIINVVWSIPTLLLVIAISFALGTGFWQIFIAIGLTMWVDIARVVRGQVISLREKEFVEASKSLGFRNMTIIFKHILPNIVGTIIVVVAANFASAILTEASLSFLGIGVQPPMPSWGTMIKENYGYIILDYAYLAIVPGIAIMLLVLCFMLLGNVLRDVLDVKSDNN